MDYAPGELVTLTGSSWQPAELVHISVEDDQGSSWRRDAVVNADGTGSFTDAFYLPTWFVATYRVLAVGSSGHRNDKFHGRQRQRKNSGTNGHHSCECDLESFRKF